MSVTSTYTATHRALQETARRFRPLYPFDVRVLLALSEQPEKTATTHQLTALLDDRIGGSGVRRSIGRLYRHGFATGIGVDGKPRRQGVVTQVTLTPDGRQVTGHFFRELDRAQAQT